MTEVSSFPEMPKPGDRIAGKYLVERVLGAGGMGCVLACEHTILRMPVAIKVLLPQAATLAGANERFLREAQSAAALRSENVARVLDMGTTERGAAFIVMEHLSGEDLREIMRKRGPLPIDEACDYLLQACEGVLEAHAQGIIHRDLKTANIFVTHRPNGKPLVKVLDFGLAKVLDPSRTSQGEDSITFTELVIGSPHYMSPEQFRSLRNADARSDIWAMGVVAYELFTGRRPFRGEGAASVMASVMQDEPERPRSLRADLPDPLDSLVMRCLEKIPARRPQWVADLVTALEPHGSSRPSSSSIQPLPVVSIGGTRDEGARAPTPAEDGPPTAPPAHIAFAVRRLLQGSSKAAPRPLPSSPQQAGAQQGRALVASRDSDPSPRFGDLETIEPDLVEALPEGSAASVPATTGAVAAPSEARARAASQENERTDLSQVATNPQRTGSGPFSVRWVYPAAIIGACLATAAVTAGLLVREKPATPEPTLAPPPPTATVAVIPTETASVPTREPGPSGSAATSVPTSSATATASASGDPPSAPTRKSSPKSGATAVALPPKATSPAASPSVVDPWARPKKSPH